VTHDPYVDLTAEIDLDVKCTGANVGDFKTCCQGFNIGACCVDGKKTYAC
jgi:hypothetical protein